ncbi:MAG: hypothetical protein AUJ47_06945 [Candidatus Marinimicrobia bacterium CG1_02_48_14]|nr:MAG: hypothetical protein AUJ47_06945 [Candidatus Marinimicrobia bacterium CG1_02_48_14]
MRSGAIGSRWGINFQVIVTLIDTSFIFSYSCQTLKKALLLAALTWGASILQAQTSLPKPMVDDFNNYTTVGEMGMTVTNFGILGEGWNNPAQPSCRYKQYGSAREMVEMFSYAGLWIGAIPVRDGIEEAPRVSTAIVDGVFKSGEEGFEFTTSPATGDTIQIRSTISSASTSPLARYFSLDAVSHQDFIADFTDRRTVWTSETGSTTSIPNHTPLGVDVHLESYAWSHSFMESFVILDYTITNTSEQIDGHGWDLKNIAAGVWVDPSVANMNYRSVFEPGSGFSWYDNINGFDGSYDANGYPRNIGYQFDYDGDDGWTQVYFGVKVLGGTGVQAKSYPEWQSNPTRWYSYYNQWRWSLPENMTFPYFNMPINDLQRYEKLSYSPLGDPLNTVLPPGEAPWLESPNSWMILESAGPFGANNSNGELITHPGESVNVVFALVGAPWSHSAIREDVERRSDLRKNADWAQKAYNGEDINGNGQLDPGEDQNFNGVLDRYIVPAPPPSPNLAVIPGDGEVTLYWDNFSEFALDPVSREQDFAGYRIYSSTKTSSATDQYTFLAEFDQVGDELGYDTGFDLIRIKDEAGQPDSMVIQGKSYFYKWVNSGVQNGWPDKAVYAVTSFDTGDPETGLVSLESSKNENRTPVIPGSPAVEDLSEAVSVYPNPYRAHAQWDGQSQRDRMVWFTRLPASATIKIYTLSGDLVDQIDHDGPTYDGTDIRNLSQNAGPEGIILAGGEHAWDLISQNDQAIATGMYVFTVENHQTGKIQVGKFLVIK